MCGIAGFLDPRNVTPDFAVVAAGMGNAISHRGPDGAATWVDAQAGIAFAHRRLAIIDLTDAGAQPMASADDRWIVTYNGEIYNFEAIRQTLEARFGPIAWRGHSDTEVLVEAIARLGFEAALREAVGMFALAAWDRTERRLSLARDRMGEKPLYYGRQDGVLLFGSELKALAAHPDFKRQLNPNAVSRYLTYGYVPTPLSIYRDIWKLVPGHFVEIDSDGQIGTARCYWTLPRPVPRSMNFGETVERFDALLTGAVGLQMRSDVPMGAFLSGGVDSSTIVALMQRQSSLKVRSFSIGFAEAAYDESLHAAAVAAHLGTEHTTLRVTPEDALGVVPDLPIFYDEPFADSSQIPTYLLAKLTREHVTVTLSGDGGDELFSGYTRYLTFDAVWGRLRRIPRGARAAGAAVLPRIPEAAWRMIGRLAPRPVAEAISPSRVRRLGDALAAKDGQDFYRRLVEIWPSRFEGESTFFEQHDIERDFPDPVLGMGFVDMGSYLPDDILVKIDRAAMAVSLEGRVPMLDHRIVEAAAELPMAMRVASGVGKQVLRQILDREVPAALIERPKQGFGIPLRDWLRGPLRDWADDLLADRSTAVSDLLPWSAIDRAWRDHRSGRDDHAHRIWIVLMLQSWARAWRPV